MSLPLLLAALLGAEGDFPDVLTPLTDKQKEQARQLVAGMVKNPRGPYSGISWFCNDGTEQLPKLNGCVERGGGYMYGVPGPEAKKLERMGLFVGTVLASLWPEELEPESFYRARALVVEKYLERALDGWVLHGAKTYRGFRQDEDEADAARELLIFLASHKEFLDAHRATLIRLSRTLPYGRGNENMAAEIRALAAQIGDADKSFATLRFKIHAAPEPQDLPAVEAWIAEQPAGELKTVAENLAAAMRKYYDPQTRTARLVEVKKWVHDKPTKAAIDAFAQTDMRDARALIDAGLVLMQTADKAVRPNTTVPERNLLLLHVIGLVEEIWIGTTADLASRPSSRQQLLADLGKLLQGARLAGLLSARELETAQGLTAQLQKGELAPYVEGAGKLQRVLEWARARLLFQLGLPLERYQAVEPQAAAVVDDILRSGAALPLAALLDRLSLDADKLRGGGHRLFGVTAAAASLRGENPGLAVGKLRVVPPGGDPHVLQRDEVALLYELPPELPPVAGVVAVGAVGSLSHVALLARNLAIPLASVSSEVATALAKHAGADVVVGVSQGRRVALGALSALSAAEVVEVRGEVKRELSSGSLTIDAARLDLATSQVLRLDEVSETDAGVRVGPKAAELGRLRRLFSQRVSDAAVIPFGAFLKHVDRPSKDGGPSPLAILRQAYKAHAEQAKTDPAAAEATLLAALEHFRATIQALPFVDGFEAEVTAAYKRLGDPAKTGVFVRSDTNVEDLKDFTGAGLNLTVPNRVGVKNVLAAIRDVWASPFTERSFRWRQRLLTNPEHVYPSVLLHKTVPSEVSGVMVTCDLENGSYAALTVSMSEGVAGVVDGGSPETLVLTDEPRPRLLASSRSVTKKLIPKAPKQGVAIEPAVGKDPLLSDKDVAEVRRLWAEVLERVPPKPGLPWDIELGMLKGKAYLMQIRPLKLSRAAATHPFLVKLDAQEAALPPVVDLAQELSR